MLSDRDVIQTVVDYGPEGNVQEGNNAHVYDLGDRVMKICPGIELDEFQRNLQALDDAGIPYPSTEYGMVDIPVYGFGRELVMVAERVEDPRGYFMEQSEHRYLEELREIGHRAAASGIKLDFCLDNFGFNGHRLPLYLDYSDPESVWHEERYPFHMMAAHLRDSLNRWKREFDFHSPGLEELADDWWGAR